jgi:hypothetical protein
MPANPNDGTQLGTGEVISDEYIDVNVGGRRDEDQPPTAYKLPRSKIAVGPYGQDWGDATEATPLQVSDAVSRRIAELSHMRDIDEQRQAFQNYAQERCSLADLRGRHISIRGAR